VKIKNDKFITLYINKKLIEIDLKDKKELESYIKRMIVLLKKKNIDMLSGLYIARVYINDKYGIIVELELLEELEFFKDMYDLKMIIFDNSDIYLEFDDLYNENKRMIYYNNHFYLNLELVYDDFRIYEFSRLVYGDELLKIKDNGKLICK